MPQGNWRRPCWRRNAASRTTARRGAGSRANSDSSEQILAPPLPAFQGRRLGRSAASGRRRASRALRQGRAPGFRFPGGRRSAPGVSPPRALAPRLAPQFRQEWRQTSSGHSIYNQTPLPFPAFTSVCASRPFTPDGASASPALAGPWTKSRKPQTGFQTSSSAPPPGRPHRPRRRFTGGQRRLPPIQSSQQNTAAVRRTSGSPVGDEAGLRPDRWRP